MFVLLTKPTLVKAIQDGVMYPGSKIKFPIGVISCRYRTTGAFLFQTLLYSKGNNVFWNEDGDSIYFRFATKIELSFHEQITKLVVNEQNVDINDIELLVNVL